MEGFSFKDETMTCGNVILGKGGFGVVFLGSCDGKPAAIKRLELARAGEKETLREQEFQTQFRHRNIVELLHVTEDTNFK